MKYGAHSLRKCEVWGTQLKEIRIKLVPVDWTFCARETRQHQEHAEQHKQYVQMLITHACEGTETNMSHVLSTQALVIGNCLLVFNVKDCRYLNVLLHADACQDLCAKGLKV